MMPISDPRDRFFYPHHTHMKDTYIIPWLFACTGDSPLDKGHGLSPCTGGQTVIQLLLQAYVKSALNFLYK